MFLFITQPTVREPIFPYLNTSHVLIYRRDTPYLFNASKNLNTSHVLIYL